jgi:hypothetical protein
MDRSDQTLRTVQLVLGRFLAQTRGAGQAAVGPESRVLDCASNSVQLLELHALLEDALGLTIKVSTLFEHDTVAALAGHLAANDPSRR